MLVRVNHFSEKLNMDSHLMISSDLFMLWVQESTNVVIAPAVVRQKYLLMPDLPLAQ